MPQLDVVGYIRLQIRAAHIQLSIKGLLVIKMAPYKTLELLNTKNTFLTYNSPKNKYFLINVKPLKDVLMSTAMFLMVVVDTVLIQIKEYQSILLVNHFMVEIL